MSRLVMVGTVASLLGEKSLCPEGDPLAETAGEADM